MEDHGVARNKAAEGDEEDKGLMKILSVEFLSKYANYECCSGLVGNSVLRMRAVVSCWWRFGVPAASRTYGPDGAFCRENKQKNPPSMRNLTAGRIKAANRSRRSVGGRASLPSGYVRTRGRFELGPV